MKVELLQDIGDKKAGDVISLASIYANKLIASKQCKAHVEKAKVKPKKA